MKPSERDVTLKALRYALERAEADHPTRSTVEYHTQPAHFSIPELYALKEAIEDLEREVEHDDDPASDLTGLEQIKAWMYEERARVTAKGNLFDTGFRCVSEGGQVFYFDPEELDRWTYTPTTEQLNHRAQQRREAQAKPHAFREFWARPGDCGLCSRGADDPIHK